MSIASSQLRLRAWFLVVFLMWATANPAPAQQKAAGLANGTPTITTTDGVQLYTKVAGKGLPCVFVHGGPGSGSYAIEALAGKTLEQNFQMIYLDQRGSGRSASDPAKNYAIERLVQDLEEVRQQLHLDKWVVMSHSFGGIIATAYASKYPERVQGLVLVNSILNLPASMESTAANGYKLLPEASRPPLDPAAPLPQRFGMVMGLLGQQGLMNRFMYANDSTPARLSRVMKGVPANRDFATTLFQGPAIQGYVQDLTPATAALKMPVLVVSGQDDYMVGPEHYKSFQFPNQQVVVVPGRHYALIESPTEFNQALVSFRKKLPRKA
ncbi:alpha/beta fold hydrolase [Hymenobacter chitinivorans]|uniref:Proline iminopeptidase n=1 Tax=Hymenobacter chitinivorans DSM 11115 TaxID=1121954 RepID=A0A2M9B491_9BACT|nr:alpha/beta fold hydrolase [Hymenobacter chitinivorans]PJJ52767.1 proline iminopeptidase [Hymenobacter chitinivorans DSM 11115]